VDYAQSPTLYHSVHLKVIGRWSNPKDFVDFCFLFERQPWLSWQALFWAGCFYLVNSESLLYAERDFTRTGQRWVKLYVAESTLCESWHRLRQWSVRHKVSWVNSEWNSTWTGPTLVKKLRGLSQRWVRLHVDSVNAKWNSMCTESTPSETVNAEWDSKRTDSMLSETPKELIQCWVRLQKNWFNAEWDSTWTESMQSENHRGLSQRWVRLNVDWVNVEWDSMWTGAALSETPCGVTQRWVRPHVESALSETLRGLRQHGVILRYSTWTECEKYPCYVFQM
jgi:hypothetical protein